MAPPSQTGSAPTITLGAFKAKVAELEAEVAAGDGSEEYWSCVFSKYTHLRLLRWTAENGGLRPKTTAYDIGSGLPAGSFLYEDQTGGIPGRPGTYWLEGPDKGFFTVETTTAPFPYTHPLGDRTGTSLPISTSRPLPAGDYTFVSEGRWGGWICRTEITELDRRQNRHTRTVNVTAPAGTRHEGFFDPVAIGAAVGADGTNGVLKPAAFTVGGASATITSLKWESGVVTMTLNPSASLAGHAVDFIALNGSVTSTLSFDDATQSGGALTWSVAAQPWNAGDLLMLRIGADATTLTTPTHTHTHTDADTYDDRADHRDARDALNNRLQAVDRCGFGGVESPRRRFGDVRQPHDRMERPPTLRRTVHGRPLQQLPTISSLSWGSIRRRRRPLSAARRTCGGIYGSSRTGGRA